MGTTFEALYYPELLHPVNPAGDVGLVTLWSPLRTARRTLAGISSELLDPARSRIAVISNLYGDGMYAMFCNLLFNPQVRHLVAIGEDLGLPTCAEIAAFLERGLEDTEMLGVPMKRVRGTGRVFPALADFDEQALRRRLSFRCLGKLSGASLGADLTAHLSELPHATRAPRRLRVELATELGDEEMRRPSELTAHQVVRRRPLDCWEELVVRTVRFGRPVTLRNGPRLELLNVKAVIAEPAEESAQALAKYGFQLDAFRDYQARILEPELPEGISYTYGNRLRGYFGEKSGSSDTGADTGSGDTGADSACDTLQAVIELLQANPESRHAHIALWDTAVDLRRNRAVAGYAAPCLISLFFRRVEGGLSLTATYRAHNLLTAWLENVYGLLAIQRHVAQGVGMAAGPITVVSNSLGIDPRSPRYALARGIAAGWRRDEDRDRETGKYSLREDPHGYFVVSVDREASAIVVEHRFEGVLVKRYSGRRADRLAGEISGDMAVSLVTHALWLGRELASKEEELRTIEAGLQILSVTRFDREELLAKLRDTPLRGFDHAHPYADATIELVPATDTDTLTPAQRYVLAPTVQKLLALRAALLAHGLDLFALDGGAVIRTSEHPDEEIPVLPPIVEESREPDGRTVLLVNDGLHRVSAARSLGLPISVVLVRGVPAEYPYYAYALPGGWSEVAELLELPDEYQKKSYRLPENYKALFREFNTVFPGTQKQRKRSNPAHLRA
jgi:thymidylate synthase